MPVAFYTDHNVPQAIPAMLRFRGSETADDDTLLNRATELNRTLFTLDIDLLAITVNRQKSGLQFSGVIYTPQMRVSFGRCVNDMVYNAQVGEPEDLVNSILYLPLRQKAGNRNSLVAGL